MRKPVYFVRIFFILLILIATSSFLAQTFNELGILHFLMGGASVCLLSVGLFALEKNLKRGHLKLFNTITLGLFFGYLMALALTAILKLFLDVAEVTLQPSVTHLIKVGILLFATYSGLALTLYASEEIHLSFPLIHLKASTPKIKEIIIDGAALSDLRIIDLASSGLLDERCVIPKFLIQEYQQLEESLNEVNQIKAKRALEVVRKLETLHHLKLRYCDNDFPDVKDNSTKIIHLARLLNAAVLSSEVGQLQASDIQCEGIQVINIQLLANSLKPLMQRGELLKIKIQRYGKEEGQGVGYLDDGTMVVVNGGGEFLGEAIKGKVLSVKHTASGRMIFCNLDEEEKIFVNK